MVGEAMMNRHSEMDPVPPHGITADMGDLTRDIVSLAELQFQLFRDDCRHGLHKLLISVALLVVAAMVALGTVPIALILLAEFLMQAAGVSGAAAYAIAALCGFIVAATVGLVGWSRLRRIRRLFQRSREELGHNLTWIKQSLKRSAPVDTETPMNRKDLLPR